MSVGQNDKVDNEDPPAAGGNLLQVPDGEIKKVSARSGQADSMSEMDMSIGEGVDAERNEKTIQRNIGK